MAASVQRLDFAICWDDAQTGLRGGFHGPASRAIAAPVDISAAMDRRHVLSRVIEREIVPRLLLRRFDQAAAQRAAEPTPPDLEPAAPAVVALAALVMAREVDDARAFVDSLNTTWTLETLCLGLLAPVARRLGELWEEDLCDFTEVTIGLMRLQQLMHRMTPLHGEGVAGGPAMETTRRRSLLVPVPGERHNFGLAMVATFFRRSGWSVLSEEGNTVDGLAAILRRDWYGLVGLSAAAGLNVEALADTIRKLRRASRNRSIGVLVGGPLFNAHPELVRLVGADATASDGQRAIWQAETLLARLPAGA